MTKVNELALHPLQTTYWAEFRKEWGNEVLETKYGLLTLHKLPLIDKRIAMFIRGPKPSKKMLNDLKQIAKEQNIIFIKLEPFEPLVRNPWGTQDKNKEKTKLYTSQLNKQKKLFKFLKKNGCVRGKTLFTPTSFQVDLSKSEEELMKGFHSKTRYNIRYAERKDVEVKEDNSNKAFERYLELTRKTVERQGFYAHTEKYHRLMWHHLRKGKNPIAHLMTAAYKDEIITTWILFIWKDMLYYPYGASSMDHKNVQANSLMMWESIRFGKKLGLNYFDLWGREPGKGFTNFKEGFNPQIVEYPGTWDLVIDKPMYYLFRLADHARWKLLRLRARLGISKYSF